MTRKPLVSILLATRNRAALLRRAISSLRRQTYAPLEILVLDDGSTDETLAWLADQAAMDSRLRVLRNDTPVGLASALNRLIAESRGDFLARMDDDDVAYPQRIERQIEYMQHHGIDVCGTWYRRVARWGKGISRPAVDDETIKTELLFQPPLLHPSVMMRRSVLERHGGYRTEFPHAEDYELWTRLAPHARFGNVPETLMDYTIAPHQVSRRFNQDQVNSAQRIRMRYLADLGVSHDQRQRQIHVSLRHPSPLHSTEELEDMGRWLELLATHFPPSQRPVLARQWHLAAIRGAGLGLATYRIWRRFPLGQRCTASKSLQLLALCAGSIEYRSRIYQFLERFADS